MSRDDVGLAIVAVREMALKSDMPGTASSALVTAVSELATNVTKYAGTGLVTLRRIQQSRRQGIEVIVEDQGPGIENIDYAMQDRISTGGTLGLGLPGTRRLVDEFEIESEIGKGTKVRVVKWF